MSLCIKNDNEEPGQGWVLAFVKFQSKSGVPSTCGGIRLHIQLEGQDSEVIVPIHQSNYFIAQSDFVSWDQHHLYWKGRVFPRVLVQGGKIKPAIIPRHND